MEGKVFSGNIYIFHAFDIGEDINLEKIKHTNVLRILPPTLPKYFKNYHIPLNVELPPTPEPTQYRSIKINDFGAISISYQISFKNTLENIRAQMEILNTQYQDIALIDAQTIFKLIAPYTKQSNFFHLHTDYSLIQVDFDPNLDTREFKEQYGNTIASLIRFETETLADYQKQDILETAIGYYRGDLIIIDSEAAFVYDEDYKDLLDLFEFGNIQHLELMYFDQVLAQRLDQLYERKGSLIPKRQFIPIIGLPRNPVTDLGRLKVDISVISEQLQNSIKLSNEPYLTEIYTILSEKLDLRGWKSSIDTKLEIIKDVNTVYYNRLLTIRSEILEVLIIVLICTELILGLFK
jgi:hypothetical protein